MSEENKTVELNDVDLQHVSGGGVEINGVIFTGYGTVYEYCHNCHKNRTLEVLKDDYGHTVYRCTYCKDKRFL